MIYKGSTLQTVLIPSDEFETLSWYPSTDLPYDEMPADYAHWLPHVMDGYNVTVFLETDQDELLGGDVYRSSPNASERLAHFPISIAG